MSPLRSSIEALTVGTCGRCGCIADVVLAGPVARTQPHVDSSEAPCQGSGHAARGWLSRPAN